jgi:hypothetical protein
MSVLSVRSATISRHNAPASHSASPHWLQGARHFLYMNGIARLHNVSSGKRITS